MAPPNGARVNNLEKPQGVSIAPPPSRAKVNLVSM